MTTVNSSDMQHDHIFMGSSQSRNEQRTLIVIGLTTVMMVVEIFSGVIFGSMALLADGWHMASHAAALGIAALGYFLARKYARSPKFTFGTGKIGELAGFGSSVLLALIALLMIYESFTRFFAPVRISFDQAIAVACIGLVVNLVSALLLRDKHQDHDEQDHHHHADHNLSAAYLHVLADALTSLLAIVALITGRFLGWVWMDPLMGIVGGLVIIRWSYNLLKVTARILLDMNPGQHILDKIKNSIESPENGTIMDIHVWRIGPGHLAATICVVAENPKTPQWYKTRLEAIEGLSHITVEVNGLRDEKPE